MSSLWSCPQSRWPPGAPPTFKRSKVVRPPYGPALKARARSPTSHELCTTDACKSGSQVSSGRAQRHPERQRDRGPVLLVEDPFVPGPVPDRVQHQAHLGEIVLRAPEPGAGASVLSLQCEPGEADAGRVDPVVVLRVLLDVPGG